MEREPKIEENSEERLRKKGYRIEKVQLSENEPIQCEKCMDEKNDFQFYQEGWFIEESFYCSEHKEGAIKALEEIDKDAEKTSNSGKYTGPENLTKAVDVKALLDESEEVAAMGKLLMDEYKKKGKNLIDEVRKWRENNPKATFGDAIRALYELE